jgi:hypothetical protein
MMVEDATEASNGFSESGTLTVEQYSESSGINIAENRTVRINFGDSDKDGKVESSSLELALADHLESLGLGNSFENQQDKSMRDLADGNAFCSSLCGNVESPPTVSEDVKVSQESSDFRCKTSSSSGVHEHQKLSSGRDREASVTSPRDDSCDEHQKLSDTSRTDEPRDVHGCMLTSDVTKKSSTLPGVTVAADPLLVCKQLSHPDCRWTIPDLVKRCDSQSISISSRRPDSFVAEATREWKRCAGKGPQQPHQILQRFSILLYRVGVGGSESIRMMC